MYTTAGTLWYIVSPYYTIIYKTDQFRVRMEVLLERDCLYFLMEAVFASPAWRSLRLFKLFKEYLCMRWILIPMHKCLVHECALFFNNHIAYRVYCSYTVLCINWYQWIENENVPCIYIYIYMCVCVCVCMCVFVYCIYYGILQSNFRYLYHLAIQLLGHGLKIARYKTIAVIIHTCQSISVSMVVRGAPRVVSVFPI